MERRAAAAKTPQVPLSRCAGPGQSGQRRADRGPARAAPRLLFSPRGCHTLRRLWRPRGRMGADRAALDWVAQSFAGGSAGTRSSPRPPAPSWRSWCSSSAARPVSLAEPTPLPLNFRVTMAFRWEDGAWRLLHRHADHLAEKQKPTYPPEGHPGPSAPGASPSAPGHVPGMLADLRRRGGPGSEPRHEHRGGEDRGDRCPATIRWGTCSRTARPATPSSARRRRAPPPDRSGAGETSRRRRRA